jgi:hypothetical protein
MIIKDATIEIFPREGEETLEQKMIFFQKIKDHQDEITLILLVE